MKNLDLTEEEAAALLKGLNRLINDDRFPLSSRVCTLKAIRAKLRPEPVREPPPLISTMSRRALSGAGGAAGR